MFGHFKANEFMDSLDGVALPAARRAHLNGCTACLAQLRSIEAAHQSLAFDGDIVEPDWSEFRGTVRTELLSRSVQRESAVRRWTGWPIRPAMAWGLSFMMLVAASVGGFYWHMMKDSAATAVIQENALDNAALDAAREGAWTNSSFFDELSNLEGPQAERLLLLLESARKAPLAQQ